MTLLLLSPRAASAFRFSACSRVSPGRAGSIAAHSRVAVCRFDSLAVRAAPATKRFAQCVLLKYCCDCGALARICAAGGTAVLERQLPMKILVLGHLLPAKRPSSSRTGTSIRPKRDDFLWQ